MDENVQGTAAPEAAEEAPVDEWADAHESFEEPELETETLPESHLEPEKVDLLNLDDLRVAHKYKPIIKERIEKILADREEKLKSETSAFTEELGQTKQAVSVLVETFREIASNPEKAAEYIEKYGEQLGIDPTYASKFRKTQVEQPQEKKEALEQIYQKYVEPLANAKDPNEFLSLMRQKDFEVANAVKQEMMGVVGNLLRTYHQQFIEPDKKLLSDYKSRQEQEMQRQFVDSSASSWNKAYDTLKGKYPDIESYKKEISKFIKSKKTLESARGVLNQDPDDVDGRGELLEQTYLLLSRQKALTQKPQRTGGLPPSQKHITTKKTGGDDWDDIYQDPEIGWSK